MTGELSSLVLLLLSSCSLVPVGGQTCSLSAAQFSTSDYTVTVSAESVDGPTPAVRVTWSTTVPLECVASVTVDFRTVSSGPVVATNTTTNTSQTEIIQTGLRCVTYYFIRVVVTGEFTIRPRRTSDQIQVLVGDVPTPSQVRAEVTADSTSIRVSWEWSRQGVLKCVNNIIVHYQPKEGSLMMYTVGSTTATSATVPNLQCNTEYDIWVVARGGITDRGSVHRMLSIPSRAPPTPTGVTAESTSTSSVNVAWQWNSSSQAPDCFNTTTVTYHPEGGGELSLQLSDPAATETTLTGFQNNTCYTITVVATAGGHRRESISRTVTLPLQVIPAPVMVKTNITADSISVRVSWQWSHQGVPMCVDLVQVHYQPEGGSVMNYTVDNTTVTSATLPNLQCNTKYTIWVYVESGSNKTGNMSVPRMVSIPARAPPTPTGVTAQFINGSSIMVAWQWTSSGPAPRCFDTTTVTYRPEGGSESSLQLNDPAENWTILTDLQCSTNYTITVVATAGGHRRTQSIRSVCPTDTPDTASGPTLQSSPSTVSQPLTGPTLQSSTSTGSQSSTDPGPQSSSNSGVVAGVAVFIVVLVLAAIGIVVVVLVIWWRRKQGSKKDAVVELAAINAMTDVDGESKEKQDTVENVCYEKIQTFPPTIVDYQREVQCSEGEQVTLTVKVAGSPTPTVTWLFNGRKVKDDYSTEVGKDGSLTLMAVEPKHAGTYTFTVSNKVGSVEGSTKLVVRAEDEECTSAPGVESNPVTREKFGEYVSSCHAQNNGGFIVQFQTLPSGEEGHQTAVGKASANKPLNRFRNIIAYDDHRVVLKSITGGVNTKHDYVNAAYIDGYSQSKRYIATQGPLPNTVTDFWWMVWQEQISVVAMVTNTMEGGQNKCEHYWPEQGSKEYGPFKVTLTDQQVFADYTIRELFVSCERSGGNQLKVTQFHFTSWPDHGVPEYAGPILNYLRRMKAKLKRSRRPTLVHCSAGVGRTGTLMAIDMALEQAARENVVDIPAIVTKMRRQRMKMVQNADQYVFIHDAVLESLTCGDTQIPASGLSGAIEKLKQKDSETGRTGFETQFHVLGQVTPKPAEVFRASANHFPDLNRSMDFLPPDKWRVVLKGENRDYIHASYANGYKQWKGFIIAQAPMNSTCRDFWKMVYERECGVIVMLSDLVENGKEVCHQYWPDGSPKGVQKYGEYSVSVLQTTKQDGFIQRTISITNPKSGEDHKVTQFQMSCWTPEGLCTSPPAIMAVIEQVLVVQRRTGNRPIVVHGSDTVSRCGVFCSFISATECCKTEGIVDVFQVVKALRIQKPGSVLTVEQYRFIFDLMLLFLESFSIYSNFK